jgi:protein gp37
MASLSNIEWTEFTWNPTTGCTKVSTGCKFCYAERWALMHQKREIFQYRDGFQLTLAPGRLEEPLKLPGRQLIFVNSMSDLLHPGVPDDYLIKVFQVMNEATRHTFQILTKRPERLLNLKNKVQFSDHIWMGVSVENADTVSRIIDLQKARIKNNFISFEPLISAIPDINLNGIGWVIVGGESGPYARPVLPEWVRDIKANCQAFDVPFFFKQWGSKRSNPNKADPTLVKGHRHYAMGGCQLNGQIFRELPF